MANYFGDYKGLNWTKDAPLPILMAGRANNPFHRQIQDKAYQASELTDSF